MRRPRDQSDELRSRRNACARHTGADQHLACGGSCDKRVAQFRHLDAGGDRRIHDFNWHAADARSAVRGNVNDRHRHLARCLRVLSSQSRLESLEFDGATLFRVDSFSARVHNNAAQSERNRLCISDLSRLEHTVFISASRVRTVRRDLHGGLRRLARARDDDRQANGRFRHAAKVSAGRRSYLGAVRACHAAFGHLVMIEST